MKLQEIAFSGYKCFPGGDGAPLQRLELAPLTLVFGRNNSGKSVVARLPRLLLGGVACDDERLLPLKVDGLRYGRRFLDLVHGGGFLQRPVLVLRGTHGEETLDLRVTLYSTGALSADDPPRVWSYEMRAPEPYQLGAPQTGPDERPPFAGLLPEGDRWDGWRRHARSLLDRMVHLGPTRASVPQSLDAEQSPPLGLDGSGAPHWLRADDALADAVSEWYRKHLDGWRLSVRQAGDSFGLRVGRTSTLAANLSQAGEGLQQVLPVVVHQLSRQRTGTTEGFLDVVEQPELHLHAEAQAPLADLFIDTALQGAGQVLVETHSQPVLLRVQRRVAEGRLPPELVALYFVEVTDEGSRLRRIRLDEGGEADWWPAGVFEEGFREVAALRRAQRRRRSDSGSP